MALCGAGRTCNFDLAWQCIVIPKCIYPMSHCLLPQSVSCLADVGIWRGGVPQIPLTLLNSVIAVCQLSGDLFPNKAPSATRVATSVGLMNLVGE